MTKSGAIEFAPHNIRVVAVCPGPQEGRMMGSINRQRNPDEPEADRERRYARLLLKRYGNVEEIAALVAFLCSDDAGFATGGHYLMDGGSITF
jgi:NAD(P)-dependent dehydrogenase (short-subunit alcohol dehydrogenase family)